MADSPLAAPSGESGIDWDSVRAGARRRLAYRLGRVEPAELDDLSQEVALGLLRASRRTTIRDVDALLTTIADRTAADFIRRKRRWALVLAQPTHADLTAGTAADPAILDDPDARVRFLVLNFFRSGNAPCAALAQAYFEQCDWSQVAVRTGRSHAAVRRQWSRCVAALRGAFRRDPAACGLWTWTKERS